MSSMFGERHLGECVNAFVVCYTTFHVGYTYNHPLSLLFDVLFLNYLSTWTSSFKDLEFDSKIVNSLRPSSTFLEGFLQIAKG